MTTSPITLNARAKYVVRVVASVGATRDAATSYAAYVRAQGLTLDMCKSDKTLDGRHARAVLALHEDYAGRPVAPPTTRLANAADRKRYAKAGKACPKRVPTAYGADVSRMVEGFKRAIEAQSPDAPKRARVTSAAEVFDKACIAAHKSAEVSLSDALASLMGAYGADAGKIADVLAEARAESASK